MDLLPRREFLLTLPRRRIAAGALIRDESGRICLVVPTYKDLKHLPGGVVEAGESPAQGLVRELREELHLDLTVGRLLVAHHQLGDADDDHGSIQFVYDCGVLSNDEVAAIAWPPDELHGVVFVAASDLVQHCNDSNVERITAALQALAEGGVVELGR